MSRNKDEGTGDSLLGKTFCLLLPPSTCICIFTQPENISVNAHPRNLEKAISDVIIFLLCTSSHLQVTLCFSNRPLCCLLESVCLIQLLAKVLEFTFTSIFLKCISDV